MDIYILHDGKQIGPFSEATAHQMLKQGVVLMNDSAWRPGIAEWIPLENILFPESAPAAASSPNHAPAPSEPATGKQTAFAAELPAKKEERPQRFFELCQTEGAEAFEGVTKAHCQVLVGYLDGKFPNWDAGKESDAARNYFFPAVAEKFPQFVRKDWKGKLEYRKSPKVEQEVQPRKPAVATHSSAKRKAPSPIASLFKGLILGLFIIALIVGGLYAKRHPEVFDKAKAEWALLKEKYSKNAKNTKTAAEQKAPATPAPASQDMQSLFSGDKNSAPQNSQTASTSTNSVPVTPAASAPSKPMSVITGSETATTMSSEPAPPLPEASSTPPSSSTSVPLFDPSPSSSTMAGDPTATAAVPAKKTTVTLMQPLELQLTYGKIKVPAGTQLPIVEQDGLNLKVRFQNQVVSVPANATDLGDSGLPQ